MTYANIHSLVETVSRKQAFGVQWSPEKPEMLPGLPDLPPHTLRHLFSRIDWAQLVPPGQSRVTSCFPAFSLLLGKMGLSLPCTSRCVHQERRALTALHPVCFTGLSVVSNLDRQGNLQTWTKGRFYFLPAIKAMIPHTPGSSATMQLH